MLVSVLARYAWCNIDTDGMDRCSLNWVGSGVSV